MGIKKKCRPLNQAKNTFIKWLKDNNAECIESFTGEDDGEWDYYNVVSGFIDESLYTVYFTMWKDTVKIDYSDENNRYDKLSIEEFLQLIL